MKCLEYWVLRIFWKVYYLSFDTKRRCGGWMDSRRRKHGAAQTGRGATTSILEASLLGYWGNVLTCSR